MENHVHYKVVWPSTLSQLLGGICPKRCRVFWTVSSVLELQVELKVEMESALSLHCNAAESLAA